jgi:hypothetical protein
MSTKECVVILSESAAGGRVEGSAVILERTSIYLTIDPATEHSYRGVQFGCFDRRKSLMAASNSSGWSNHGK